MRLYRPRLLVARTNIRNVAVKIHAINTASIAGISTEVLIYNITAKLFLKAHAIPKQMLQVHAVIEVDRAAEKRQRDATLLAEQMNLAPIFSLVGGVWSRRLLRQRRFYHVAVNGLQTPRNPFQFVVFGKSALPNLEEDTPACPFEQVAVGARRGTTRAQNAHDCREDQLGVDALAPTAFSAFVVAFLLAFVFKENEGFDLPPKVLRKESKDVFIPYPEKREILDKTQKLFRNKH